MNPPPGPAAPTGSMTPDVPPLSGCVVCGAELVYLPAAEPLRCVHCGGAFESAARCPAGHYVCDVCHSGSAKDVIASACAGTDATDPVELALGLMRHPSVKLHGPEHHFMVPAVLLATYANATGAPERRAAWVAEARRRSEPVLGGFCGLQGACGAAIGTGIFVAIATGSTPLDGPRRGLANRMTARALDVVSRTGGARCCKRDSLLSILAAARFAGQHLGVALPARGVACEFSERNAQCLEEGCPFYRDAGAEPALAPSP